MYERKIKLTGGLQAAYKRYKTVSGTKTISREMYTGICQDFNKALSNKIITESFEYKIPYGLGHLRIKSSQQKIRIKDGKIQTCKMAIDWNSTKKLWREMYPGKTSQELKEIPNKKILVHTNEHTDGKIMRWYWDRRISNFKNQTVYKFKPVKGGEIDNNYTGRLGLSAWINSDDMNNEYYE